MRNAKLIVPVILVVAVAALIGALAARSMGDSNKQAVVKTRMVGAKTLLVNRRGFTLYHLSVERRGHFICTGACLAEWHPLVVAKGKTPTGAKSLGTVKRPDGRLQVAYKGGPLYTFAEDQQARRHEGQRLQGRRHVARRDGLRQGRAGRPQPSSGSGYGGSGY